MKKLSKKVPFFKRRSKGLFWTSSNTSTQEIGVNIIKENPGQRLFYNQILDKKGTKKILSWFLENYGPTRTSQFIEELKSVGFHFATEAGLSLGFDDLRIPSKKSILLNTAEADVLECEKRYFQGSITAVERYQKLIDIWTTASENLKDEVIQNFQETDLFNPLYMMAFSGARGNISQVRQLVGMRGLMSDSAGGIIDFPIRSNFREGLTVTEYAISCYGARKGLIDTALRTADSGYLTRRLVDVAHGIMIGRLECNTKESFEISPLKASGKSGSESILLSLEKRILGRVLAEDILQNGPSQGTSTYSSSPLFIAHKNQEISPSLAQKIVQFKKETVHVRSPLTCRHFQNLREDICQLCYGWSLAHGRLVSIGEAVGILAAQSIGEPGTQLTMRTFHTGGIFSTDIDAKIFAPHNGFVSFSKKAKGRKIRTFHGQTAFFTFEPLQLKISSNADLTSLSLVEESFAKSKSTTPESELSPQLLSNFSLFNLPAHSLVFVYPGQFISKNILCAEVAQLMSAKIQKSNYELESFPALVELAEVSTPTDRTSLESKTKEINALGTSPVFNGKAREGELKEVQITSNNFHEAGFGLSPRQPLKTNGTVWKSGPSSGITLLQSEIQLPEEEENLDDELAKPNSKKVLSELEGQIYFHRLAERRQLTEFEKFSQVKGVGSLWVLGGKKVFASGPFQSGDFVLKKKKSKARLQRVNGGLTINQAGLNSANNQNKNIFSSEVIKSNDLNFKTKIGSDKSIIPIRYYKIDFSKWFLTLPVRTIGIFHKNKSSQSRKNRTKEKTRIIAFSPKSEAQELSLSSDWLKKQQETPFPSSSIVAFCLIKPSEKSLTTTFVKKTELSDFPNAGFSKEVLHYELNPNRVRISKKFSSSFNQRDFLKKNFDFLNLNATLDTRTSKKDKSNSSFLLNPAYFYSFKKSHLVKAEKGNSSSRTFFEEASFTKNSTISESKEFKIFSFPTFGYFEKILENHFIWTANLDNYSIFSNFINVSLFFKNEFNKNEKNSSFPFWKNIVGLQQEYYNQNTQFDPGELRFVPDRKGRSAPDKTFSFPNFLKEKKAGINPVDEMNSGNVLQSPLGKKDNFKIENTINQTSKESENFGSSARKALNLKTSDLRFYKINETLGDHNLAISAKRKIGELVRVGDEIEKKFSLDKTNQIIRRTRVSKNNSCVLGLDEVQNRLTRIPERKSSQNSLGIGGIQQNNVTTNLFYTLRRVHPYLISNNSPLAVSHGDIVDARQFLFELFYQQSKTGDIVQGLPKIEQLFEARRTSLHVIETVHVRLKEKFQELCNEYPHYEAARLSIRFIQRILIDEIQLVYQSQGVDIADKHIEIIIRQMTSKVIIHEKGKSPFFPDDIIDFHQIGQFELSSFTENKVDSKNSAVPFAKEHLASKIASSGIVFEPIVLGLTKISFLTQSFISAASFQETKRVLMNAAVQSRVDFLYGLKENVIVGRFIRAGTGFRTSLFPAA
jgi:hypothetical protein